MHSLSKFQVYNTELMTIVTMLYIRNSRTYLIYTESMYPLTNISPYSLPPQPVAFTIRLSGALSLTYLWFQT